MSLTNDKLRIAIVGCGVAGLTAAWLLQRRHEVHLFEKNDYPGGHTRTLKVSQDDGTDLPVDTGFIVMNHRNYPNFTKILKQLNVALADSSMSFSFFDAVSGYGYSGNSLSSLFPSISYFLKPNHLKLIGNLIRFAKVGYRDLQSGFLKGKTLSEYCAERKLGTAFLNNYLYPMGAAIWSSPIAEMHEFPAQPYLHFLENHGLIRLTNRPQWKYVKGGSQTYVRAMLKTFERPPNLNSAPASIQRIPDGIRLHMPTGATLNFDHVVIGAHADEALKLLADPSAEETSNLSPWRYQPNTVTLHTDSSQLPAEQKLWSSWNFVREPSFNDERPVAVSYYMNQLQDLQTDKHYIVTLNNTRPIADDSIINTTTLTHPLYSSESMATQDRLRQMNGQQNTWFCGSYFGYGFHEDAVQSAVEVARKFGITL